MMDWYSLNDSTIQKQKKMSIPGSTRPGSNPRPLTCKVNDSPVHHDDERISVEKYNIFDAHMSGAIGWCQ